MSESQSRLVGTVDLIHLAAQSTDPITVIGTYLANPLPNAQRENVAKCARIESEQYGFGIIHTGRHQDGMAKAEDFRPIDHLGRDVTISGKATWSIGTGRGGLRLL